MNWSCNVSETEEEQLSSDEEKGKKKISLSNLSKLMNKIYSDDYEGLTLRNVRSLSSKKLSLHNNNPISEDVESENAIDEEGNSSDGSSSTMSFRSRRSRHKMGSLIDAKEPKLNNDENFKITGMTEIEPI